MDEIILRNAGEEMIGMAMSTEPAVPLVGPEVVVLVSDRLPATDTINQWRDWVKHQVGKDSYAEIKHETVDAIFDAAIVGMRLAKRSRVNMKREIAVALRSMAEQIDRADC